MVAVANVYETLDETSIRKMVMPKLKLVFEKNQSDLKIMANVLNCIERTLDKLDKSQVIYNCKSTIVMILILRIRIKEFFLYSTKLQLYFYSTENLFVMSTILCGIEI